jgi:hypothetical protein
MAHSPGQRFLNDAGAYFDGGFWARYQMVGAPQPTPPIAAQLIPIGGGPDLGPTNTAVQTLVYGLLSAILLATVLGRLVASWWCGLALLLFAGLIVIVWRWRPRLVDEMGTFVIAVVGGSILAIVNVWLVFR